MQAEPPDKSDQVGVTARYPQRRLRAKIFLYLGGLISLVAFGAPFGGFVDIPISFLLKNKLHLEAHELAHFRLVAAVPLYLSFLFGFVRDSWNPFGLSDRGFMMGFGALGAVLYTVFAYSPVTYATLLIAVLLLTACFLFVASAQNGLTAMIGRQFGMSGQVSAVWNVFLSVPTVGALILGGALSQMLDGKGADETARALFLAGAAVMASLAVYAMWRPGFVFDHVRPPRPAAGVFADLRKLARHWPIYPALLIWLLWNFAPGTATPLQYYLQNNLGADDAQWGHWNAVFSASFIPTFVLFGVLCQRLPLRTLLFWGTIVALPQMVPLLFIDSAGGALIAAVPIGLMGGVVTAAYLDLIMRSTPSGLEGTTLMMSSGLYFISVRFGDVFGSYIYGYYGSFTACVIATTAAYALIIPTLRLVPRHLVARADGWPTPGRTTIEEEPV